MSTDTASSEHTEHVEHHEGPSDLGYIKIFLFLVVVTGAEVALSYMIEPLGPLFLPLLLILMAIKFFTVASYFMHLKFDSKIFTVAFYGGLFLALGVYIVTLLSFEFF